jgi:hypothetical protein
MNYTMKAWIRRKLACSHVIGEVFSAQSRQSRLELCSLGAYVSKIETLYFCIAVMSYIIWLFFHTSLPPPTTLSSWTQAWFANVQCHKSGYLRHTKNLVLVLGCKLSISPHRVANSPFHLTVFPRAPSPLLWPVHEHKFQQWLYPSGWLGAMM